MLESFSIFSSPTFNSWQNYTLHYATISTILSLYKRVMTPGARFTVDATRQTPRDISKALLMRYADSRVASLTIIGWRTKVQSVLRLNRRRTSSMADPEDDRTQASRVTVYPRRDVVVSRPDILPRRIWRSRRDNASWVQCPWWVVLPFSDRHNTSTRTNVWENMHSIILEWATIKVSSHSLVRDYSVFARLFRLLWLNCRFRIEQFYSYVKHF